jgi:flagellar M-ring protein FliF
VVGPDRVRASVHVEYELGTSEDTQETYDPKTTATLTQEHSEESSTGAAPVGVPGTASNVPSGTPAPASTSAAEQSTSRSDATTYAVSKILHHSVEPAGRVRRIAAAVVVDDVVETTEQAGKRTMTRRKRTADEMKELEQLARAAIGVDTQRGDVLAVENLSFQETPAEVTPAPPTRIEQWSRLIAPWKWALRYLGLAALFLVIYWLVLRPVKKQALAAFRELPGRVSTKLAPQPLAAAESGTLTAADGSSIEEGGKRANQLKRLLTEKVKAEPETASRLVQSWVQQDET